MNELTVLCMENGCFKVLDTVVNFWIYIHGTKSDPCLTSKVLINVGSRNDQCLVTDFPLNERPCDQYLDQDWYRTDDGVIRTKAPVDGNCGADAAAWLKDALPAVSDGVANRTICIREGSNNCEGEFSIEIKNCGLFFVYYLLPIQNIFNCPAAYCFDSSLPCTTSMTTTSTTTTTKTQTGSTSTDENNLTLIVCLAVILPVAVLAVITVLIARVLWKKPVEPTNGKAEENANIQIPYTTTTSTTTTTTPTTTTTTTTTSATTTTTTDTAGKKSPQKEELQGGCSNRLHFHTNPLHFPTRL
ncbi:hypothetical protein DPMN_144520 [Dreissena polymorpha]|uniref:UMOD/GP2/OIT3-like D8C domain-containing protein n=1 Tax=Dreissena polymorpha TaxID=45954 RepID=A0A9D4GF54_DREPO|nr:hypothetical protein DPMN_144520 [Dreissena polymorpha]